MGLFLGLCHRSPSGFCLELVVWPSWAVKTDRPESHIRWKLERLTQPSGSGRDNAPRWPAVTNRRARPTAAGSNGNNKRPLPDDCACRMAPYTQQTGGFAPNSASSPSTV